MDLFQIVQISCTDRDEYLAENPAQLKKKISRALRLCFIWCNPAIVTLSKKISAIHSLAQILARYKTVVLTLKVHYGLSIYYIDYIR